ncbi:MAG: response regulator [Brucellaceae bacterium]|nr:response regulator [Brucellaceae bacterium]
MAPQNRIQRNVGPLIDEASRPVAVSRIFILGAILIAVAAALGLFRDRFDEPIVVGILGIFAIVGFFYLFGSIMGFIKLAPKSDGGSFSKAYLDTSNDGLVITDQKSRIVYANRAYAELTGAKGAADIKSVESLLSREDEAAHILYMMSNRLRDGLQASEEFRLAHPLGTADAEPRWYRVTARALEVPGHSEPHFIWKLADISGERAEQERFFQDLQQAIDHLDHAPAGFFAADSDWRITYLNATLADWLGVDLASFSAGGLSVPQIVAGDGMALLKAIRAEPGETRTATVDLDLEKNNGEILPVRFLHSVTANRNGLLGTARTIVLNRARGEESASDLQAAEMRFNRFFNSAPMAIAGVSRDGRIVRTNARFLSMFSGIIDRDAVDRRIRLDRVIHERDRDRLTRAIEAAAEKRAEIEPVDSAFAEAEERHIRFYVSATTDSAEADEVDEAAIIYAVEITEQKALEAQMAQSQKMQAVGQLAGGIAHDFNNVLTAIIMASDLLLSNHRPSDPSFPDIMNIKQNANRAASLVRQLLAFSRRQTLRPQVLELTDVMADLRMLLARLAGNEVKLTMEHGRDLWPVKADIGQLEQVVVNLTVNARDAMPDGGSIAVRTSNVKAEDCASFGYREMDAADYVLIEVEDDGSGIPPDVKEKIFEPFFTTKEVGKGTGLGLSMVYGIIKQTGGFIFCDSEVGKGTTFRIFLPRHIREAVPETAETSAAEQPAKSAGQDRDLSGTATVLLVEDEDAVRMGGVRALTSRGYTVKEAASGAEALDIFNESGGAIDIIVSDVVMPEMDGPTLLGEVRKIQPDIKFIFVSGYAEDAFAKNLPEDATFGFLPKPFSLKQLAATVKEVLESDKETDGPDAGA